MERPTETEVQAALDIILTDKPAYTKSLNYAIEYVKYGKQCTGYDLQVQCLYILNNISHWRHPEAKRVRQILKDFIK